MTYAQFDFFTKDEVERNWLISIFGDYGFEGFEETEDALKAFVPSGKVDIAKVQQILNDNDFSKITFSTQQLEDKNWNEEWEKNFSPVTVAKRVGIRAPFHSLLNTEFELVIEPKMSFGTGHHATTAGMIELMLKEDFVNKNVLDFGSGTGVLAILAEKLKAAKTVAIDLDEWAYKNCIENIERNNCVKINAVQADDSYVFSEKFDIILANINRNVILKNMAMWNSLLPPRGTMMVSGILLSDEQDILNEAQRLKLKLHDKLNNSGWLAISFKQL